MRWGGRIAGRVFCETLFLVRARFPAWVGRIPYPAFGRLVFPHLPAYPWDLQAPNIGLRAVNGLTEDHRFAQAVSVYADTEA